MPDCLHFPCPGCGWCPCWQDDPLPGDPPIGHAAWHQGPPTGLTDQDIVELAYAPAPDDVYAVEDIYVPGVARW